MFNFKSISFSQIADSLTKTIKRFPLTTLLLIALAAANAWSINNMQTVYEPINYIIWPLALGVFMAIYAQVDKEAHLRKATWKIIVSIIILAIVGLHIWLFSRNPEFLIPEVKTLTLMFVVALFTFDSPTKNREDLTFYENFLIYLKSFFKALFFTAVLAAGLSAIIGAVDFLLFNLPNQTYQQVLNFVFIIFGGIFFLGQLPNYQSDRDPMEIAQAKELPKWLRTLIAYVIIPLITIYTLVLLIYIFMNIGGNLWQNNLLESLLISYAIILLITLVLSENIEFKWVGVFNRVGALALALVAGLQTVVSYLQVQDSGITHGRYYVILFGIFTFITALLLLSKINKRYTITAFLALVLTLVAVYSPVNAFSLSRTSQENRLTNTLQANNMIKNNTITPREDLKTEDKVAITESAQYLYEFQYIEDLAYLEDDFVFYEDFTKTFGFSPFYKNIGQPTENYTYANLDTFNNPSYIITDYDVLVFTNNAMGEQFNKGQPSEQEFEYEGQTYIITWKEKDSGNYDIIISQTDGPDLITINFQEIVDKIIEDAGEATEIQMTVEQATHDFENDQVKVRVLVKSYMNDGGNMTTADLDLLIDFK